MKGSPRITTNLWQIPKKIPSVVICGYCGNLAIRGFKHPSGLRQKKHKLLELMDIAMSDFAYFLHFLKKFEP